MASIASANLSRARPNRTNPRTFHRPAHQFRQAGSSQNALKQRLNSSKPVPPSEALAAFNRHVQQISR
jgi:hypothetical protein